MEKKGKREFGAVIFDFDDTLVNTKKAVEDAYEIILSDISQKYGIDKGKLKESLSEIQKEMESRASNKRDYDRANWFRTISGRLGIGMTEEDIQKYADIFYSSVRDNVGFHNKTEDILIAIKRKGKKLVLFTDKDAIKGQKKARLDKLAFVKHFDLIVISGETIPERKSDPASFHKVREMIGMSAGEIIMIGDRPDMDIDNAKIEGMSAALFRGYSKHDLCKYTPDFILESIEEVFDIL
ncbi:HAD family hydrolase [Candidatus Parvarchaeota archaeon]|nr:HAD family hydrolase [Candidatus Parvarchaeota archaeon]